MSPMPFQQQSAASRSIMPPHRVVRHGFPDDAAVASLLAHAITRDLGACGPIVESRILSLVPTLITDPRVTSFAPQSVELQLVAHGDGAFYKRHIDTWTAGIGGDAFVDIMPKHNSLLVFPSWAPHEVMPVRCPSGRFVDARFAVNCWVRRKKASA